MGAPPGCAIRPVATTSSMPAPTVSGATVRLSAVSCSTGASMTGQT